MRDAGGQKINQEPERIRPVPSELYFNAAAALTICAKEALGNVGRSDRPAAHQIEGGMTMRDRPKLDKNGLRLRLVICEGALYYKVFNLDKELRKFNSHTGKWRV